MFSLAAAKRRTGNALENSALVTEAKVTVVDGLLVVSVLTGLVMNAALGWWRADTAASLVILGYGITEGIHALNRTNTPAIDTAR